MITEEIKQKLQVVAKGMNKTITGNFCMTSALNAASLPVNHINVYYLRKACLREERTNPEFVYGLGSDTSSMALGPVAIGMGWERIKQPAVYEIVNIITGRRYIGSSSRPDLRRAVHLYWLKNYWRYGVSNVFFGSLQLAADIKNHGVNSFRMEILKSCPGLTRTQLLREEEKVARKFSVDQIYNRSRYEMGTRRSSPFLEIEPEFAQIHSEYWAFNSEVAKLKTNSAKQKKRQADRIIELNQRYKMGIITGKKLRWLVKEQIAKGKLRRTALATAIRRLKEKHIDLLKKSAAFKEKYAKTAAPLY